MTIESLTERDQRIVLQSMKVALKLIDEWEMHSRLGFTRETLTSVIAQWPKIDDSDQNSDGFLAINNSLNEACHGLAIDDWDKWFDASLAEVRQTYQKWLDKSGTRGGIR